MELPDRIERKIERIPFCGCWIWIGSAARYGQAWHAGRLAPAHRVVYQLAGGQIADGMELMHSCDIGLCVNPDHLAPGTHRENMADMARKVRGRAPTGDGHWTRKDVVKAREVGRKNIAKTHGRGAQNNNAKVTQNVANQIRAIHGAQPELSMENLGRLFGIGREQTRKIIKGIVWKS